MLVFFDTEFSGLKKDTDLISIGLITEDGKEFYCEMKNIDVYNQDDWIVENVLANTVHYGKLKKLDLVSDEENYHFMNRVELKEYLKWWLEQLGEEVQLVSDVCHFDMVLFIDIFGTSWDLPKNVIPVCHDINQDIAIYEGITDKEAFDYSRETFVQTYGKPIEGAKHNSLYDAKIIKEIYEICRGE